MPTGKSNSMSQRNTTGNNATNTTTAGQSANGMFNMVKSYLNTSTFN